MIEDLEFVDGFIDELATGAADLTSRRSGIIIRTQYALLDDGHTHPFRGRLIFREIKQPGSFDPIKILHGLLSAEVDPTHTIIAASYIHANSPDANQVKRSVLNMSFDRGARVTSHACRVIGIPTIALRSVPERAAGLVPNEFFIRSLIARARMFEMGFFEPQPLA